jgi:hypothetical protein
MTTATLSKPDLWSPLRHLLHWLLPSHHVGHIDQTILHSKKQYAPLLVAPRARPMPASTCFKPNIKPLRIVRVLETGQPRAAVGRMVISGRMADVCAELDRLAACEAA